MKKLAITGGGGFIGRKVIDLLKTLPDIHIIFATRKINDTHVDNKKITYVQFDINDSSDCQKSYSILKSPDVLINLAWENLDDYNSVHHSKKTLKNQYLFLSCMVKDGLKTLVNAGTCFEYGMVSGEIDEKTLTNPISSYAVAKDELRKKLEFLKFERNFNFNWLRLFYMYGEGQDSRTIFSQFMNACRNSEPVFNMSPGGQLRDYLKVEEVAVNVVKIALLELDLGVINICSGKPIAIADLVESWKKEYGFNIKLNLGHYPYLKHEPMDFWGSNLKLNKIKGNMFNQ